MLYPIFIWIFYLLSITLCVDDTYISYCMVCAYGREDKLRASEKPYNSLLIAPACICNLCAFRDI